MEIQNTSEMTPYFTMTKCNKWFITLLVHECFTNISAFSSDRFISNSANAVMVVLAALLPTKEVMHNNTRCLLEHWTHALTALG